jgi:hypothetical protein
MSRVIVVHLSPAAAQAHGREVRGCAHDARTRSERIATSDSRQHAALPAATLGA